MPVTSHGHLSIVDKAATLFAWTIGGAMFLTVGWMAMVPDDPLAAVSLINRSNWPAMWIQATALVAVASALGAALAGRALTDAGVFVAALGLSLVSVKGGTAAEFFVGRSADTPAGERALSMAFAGELLAWLVTMLIAIIVSTVIFRWLHRAPHAEPTGPQSGGDLPGIGAWLTGNRSHTPVQVGAKHALLLAAAGWVLFLLLSSGHTTRSITHGQACFTVVASTCLGIYFVQRMFPVQSAMWSILGITLLSLAGAFWSVIVSGWGAPVPNLPSSPFLRVLPIQYIAIGSAFSVVMHWYMDSPATVESHDVPTGRSLQAGKGAAR
ncbi:MAG: hypothetical protein J5J06_03710 [Phycisphaerae bacterium]|nr:hypothetical protein [Phycisphaerae bacterium]